MKLSEETTNAICSLLIGGGLCLAGFLCGITFVTPPVREPVKVSFSLEGAGICKVAGGGKTWLLVDMTKEFLVPEDIEKVKEENLK